VLSGTATPTTEGVDGDFYIDTDDFLIYGPKTGGSWGGGTSLVGPQGSSGAQGATGAQGSTGSNGAQGATGAQGFAGSNGAQGATGAQGVDGAQGATGSHGATGAQGATGLPGVAGIGFISGATNGNIVNSATSFLGAYFDYGNGDPTEAAVAVKLAGTGSTTFSSFRALFNGAPGAGKTWTLTLRKNGADTALTCIITGTVVPAQCIDSTHSAVFSAGDTVDVKVVPTGGPSAKPLSWVAGG
jgi:hypothetical protein